MSFNFAYLCFFDLSIGEGSNQEVFDKRLKTHTVDKKEVKEDEIKKKYITLSFFILWQESTFNNITYVHDKHATKYAYTHI